MIFQASLVWKEVTNIVIYIHFGDIEGESSANYQFRIPILDCKLGFSDRVTVISKLVVYLKTVKVQ